MPFVIPDDGATAESHAQAAVDQVDWQLLGQGGMETGVVLGLTTLGCAVTPGSGLAVNISAGLVMVQAAQGMLAVVANLAITANASGNPRFDLVVASVSGATATAAVVTGTAAAAPVFPAVATDGQGNLTRAILAAVYVANGAASLLAADIVDKRFPILLADEGLAWMAVNP